MPRLTIIRDEHHKHPFVPWLICSIGAIFYCYEYLLRTAPSVMSHSLMRDFHLTAVSYGDLVAFFYYAYTPMQLVVGVFMDRYGPRRLLMLACISCAIGSFLFGFTDILWVAAASRFLIGLGSAFAFVGALKLATIWLPPERFAFVSGSVTALGMLGAMFGDVFLTHLVETHGWRTAMFYSGWVGIFIVILVILIVHDKIKTSYFSFLYKPEPGFKEVFKGLWQVIKYRYIWINGIIGCCLFLVMSAFAELWGVPYLIQVHHFSQTQAASAVSTIFLGWAIGGPLTGWLSDFIRRRRPLLIMGSFIGAIFIAILLYVPIHSVTSICVLLLLFGLATSVESIVFAVAREISPENISGTAIAWTNMLVMLGGVLFQPIIGLLLDLLWQGHSLGGVRVYSLHGYQVALSILPLVLTLSAVLGFFLRETHAEPVK